MARKKYEFRPDTPDNDILGKLLLTKTQRQSVLRWSLFSLVCLACLIVQDVVMSRVSIFGSTTDLVPCCILAICVLQGTEASCGFALGASIVYQLSGSAPGAYCIPLLTALAIFAAIFRQSYLRKGFGALLVCVALALFLYELGLLGINVFLRLTTADRVNRFLVTALSTLVVVPVLYPVLLSIGKIGGETWKE